jgi:hypothetical protein
MPILKKGRISIGLKPFISLILFKIFRIYIYNNKLKIMENSKTEMKQLFSKLKNTIPTRSKGIYLSDGLYLMENGDVLEENIL